MFKGLFNKKTNSKEALRNRLAIAVHGAVDNDTVAVEVEPVVEVVEKVKFSFPTTRNKRKEELRNKLIYAVETSGSGRERSYVPLGHGVISVEEARDRITEAYKDDTVELERQLDKILTRD